MRLFLKGVSIFVSILLIYCGAMFLLNRYLIKRDTHPVPKKHILIIGDSHARRDIDPAMLVSAYNIGLNSQPYSITYWTLKKIIKNYGCDTVIIMFSYNDLSAIDDEMLFDKQWSGEMLARSYTLVGLDSLEQFKLDKNEYYRTIFRNMMLYPKLHPIRYIGAYNASKLHRVPDVKKYIKKYFYYNDKLSPISRKDIKYLNLMIALCKQNAIVPVLVAGPILNIARAKIPSIYINSFDSLKTSFAKRNVTVLDFTAAPFADQAFLNCDHLNATGVIKFTHMVDSGLKSMRRDSIKTGK